MVSCGRVSQNERNKNTMTISETIKMNFPADLVVVNFDIFNVNRNSSSAARVVEERVDKLMEIFLSNNFKKESLKIQNFSIREEFEYGYYNSKKRVVGYRASQNLILSVAYSKDNMKKIFDLFGNSGVEASLFLSFTISDMDKIEEVLIEKLVEKSNKKARIISENMGVTLLRAIDIIVNPDMTSRHNKNQSFGTLTAEMSKNINENIGPVDIELSSSSQITWHIK
ncbi:hypothetical protein JBKA6_0350 [Ichthyobacterium seriolicida]|uniref:DUF541 domain-containing protein n=2 Tax=Ichthyobacterium seriolicida TaxID=242600 RepID=A0A1J1E8W4_9FLAO|nr:hypothetical protein JBKA6_0350 [Ichthyobacterium seriolicida]